MRRRQGALAIRRRKHRPQKGFYIGIAAAALTVLVVLYLVFFTGLFRPAQSFFRLGAAENAQVSAADSSMIYSLKGTTLYASDVKGENKWAYKFSSGQMQLCSSKNLICLYSQQTATVISTAQAPLFTLPVSDFVISDVECGLNFIALLCTMPEQNAQYIRIFDTAGNEIDRMELPATQVLKMGFYGESDNFWYLTLDSSGVEVISTVTVTVPSQQKVIGIYDTYGQLVSDVCFFGSDLYLSDTTSLSVYNTFDQSKQSETLIYGTKLVDSHATSNDLFLAYAPVSSVDGSTYTIRLLSRSGLDTLIQLPSGISHFALSERYIYCFSKDSVYVYAHTGEFVKSIPVGFEITSFRKLCPGVVLLGGPDGLYTMPLS